MRQAPASLPTDLPLSDAAAALLHHFPNEVRGAYVRLRETGDPRAAEVLVLAIVAEHMPRREAELVDSASLAADLGFDSVAIAEMVFFFEDLLQVNVTNNEIVRVRTVGDLRAFVGAKLAQQGGGLAPASRA